MDANVNLMHKTTIVFGRVNDLFHDKWIVFKILSKTMLKEIILKRNVMFQSAN